MKTVLRIFNFVILALSATATILLFAMPPMHFNSKVVVNVEAFSEFVPETDYTKDIDIVKMIGTSKIEVSLKLDMDSSKMAEFMGGDKESINSTLIMQNISNITDTLREPVDLITDFTIRSVVQSTVQDEVTKQLQSGIDEANKEKTVITSTAEDIMLEVGLTNDFFKNFAIVLYNAANTEGATIDDVNAVLIDQINLAIAMAESCQEIVAAQDLSGNKVNISDFSETYSDEIKANLLNIFNQLNLVKEDNVHLKQISKICYVYLSEYLSDGLKDKVESSELVMKPEETYEKYSDRLLGYYVTTMLPQEFYDIVGYVALGLFIGLFVFAALWIILFIITLIKTFTPKPWTIFGPWFWILGSLQIVLGIVLSAVVRNVLPNLTSNLEGVPIDKVLVSLRTYALVPSILFIVCIPIAIAYAVIRHNAKRQYKMKKGAPTV